ncbi:hypothetical protein ACFLTP_04615 [Chloroflexota bacterium]
MSTAIMPTRTGNAIMPSHYEKHLAGYLKACLACLGDYFTIVANFGSEDMLMGLACTYWGFKPLVAF